MSVAQPEETADLGEPILTWEFPTPPTVEQARALLASVPDLRGSVPYADFADYVIALPREQKVWMERSDRPGSFHDPYVQTFTLYMSVAGRLKMLEALMVANGWTFVLCPEPVTSTGNPGYLSLKDRIIYRVYLRVFDEQGQEVAQVHGTAWVPEQGGNGPAAGSPYEKVETSALGRALAAFGVGVFPGSGISSVEEISAAQTNRARTDAEAQARGSEDPAPSRRQTREETIAEAKGLVEELRLERGETEDVATKRVGEYLVRIGAPAEVWNPKAGVVDWDKVKPGQVVLLVRETRKSLQAIAAAAGEV